MSELINARVAGVELRSRLRMSVSVATLLSLACSAAHALDDDRPTVWIELGGQLEHMSGASNPFTPPYLTAVSPTDFVPFNPLNVEKGFQYSYGGEGSIDFAPEGSDWNFSASIRYGRSNGHEHKHASTIPAACRLAYVIPGHTLCAPPLETVRALDADGSNRETHAILDFQVGRDFGLGLFGQSSRSTIKFGIRFAEMGQRSKVNFNDVPDLYDPSPFNIKYDHTDHHHYFASAIANRSFRGFGPSLSWKGNTSIVGGARQAGITLDWGVNASILLGRQKALIHHQTTGNYYKTRIARYKGLASHYQSSTDHDRERSVVVPNLGGFAGLSFRYPNAKVSLGYRADFFFGAMDGGIDTRKNENVGFYGPFATISIGVGG